METLSLAKRTTLVVRHFQDNKASSLNINIEKLIDMIKPNKARTIRWAWFQRHLQNMTKNK